MSERRKTRGGTGHRTALVSVLAAAMLCGFAHPAHAQDDAEADRLVSSGVAAYKRQDYEAARTLFLRAYQLAPRYPTLLNLGLAELQSNHPVEALRHLEEYLRATETKDDRARMVETTYLPKAMSMTMHITIEAPRGAQVLIDGESIGKAPLDEPVHVLPGRHRIEVDVHGTKLSKDVEDGAAKVLAVRFEEPARPAPAPVATAPAPQPDADADVPQSASHEGTFGPRTIVVGGLGVAALASLGVGLYFASDMGKQTDTIAEARSAIGPSNAACASNAPPAACGQLGDAVSTRSSDEQLRNGFFIGAGALAVGAVATWFLWPRSRAHKAGSAWILPTGDAHGGGVRLGGTF